MSRTESVPPTLGTPRTSTCCVSALWCPDPPPHLGVPNPIVDQGPVLGAVALLPPPLGYLCCDSAPCLESSRPFPAPTPRTRPAPPPSGSSQSKTYPRTRVAAQLMGQRGTTTPGVSCGGSPCAPSALCWPCCGGCKPHPCREAPSTAHAWRRRGRPYLAGKLGAGSTAPHGIRVPFTLRLCCGTGSHPHVVPAGGGWLLG